MVARLTLNLAGMDSALGGEPAAELVTDVRGVDREIEDQRAEELTVSASMGEREPVELRAFVVGVPAGRYRLLEIAMTPALSRRLGLLVRDCGRRISIAELVDALLARNLPRSSHEAGDLIRDYLAARSRDDLPDGRRLRLPESTRLALDALVRALEEDHPAWKVNRSVVIASIIEAHLPSQPAQAVAICDELRLARLLAG